MKPDGKGRSVRDYSGMKPRELREQGVGGLQRCAHLIEAHEILDEIERCNFFPELKRAVLRLAQFTTGEL